MEKLENKSVMLRLHTSYGYSNTWWRVMFIDTDETFIGRLERCDKREYINHQVGEDVRFPIGKIQHVLSDGEQICGSELSICRCNGLCHNK